MFAFLSPRAAFSFALSLLISETHLREERPKAAWVMSLGAMMRGVRARATDRSAALAPFMGVAGMPYSRSSPW